MDIYKLTWTRLQNEIFRLLCVRAGESLNQRTIAKRLGVSATAISKSLLTLENGEMIVVKKDKNMNLNLVELNRDKEEVIQLKRVENLKMIYESEIVKLLEDKFPGSVIILFGSYSYGEDNSESDIDLAVIGCKEKEIDLSKYEKLFEKEIRINFYAKLDKINDNLKSNIFNGIVLVGRIEL